MHREGLDVVLTLHSDDGRVSTLGDDRNTLALLVLLWQVGEMLDDGWNIVSLEVVRVGVRHGLSLVSNDVVPVGCGLVDLVLEELRDERRRQREDERLHKDVNKTTIVPTNKWQPNTLFSFAASSASAIAAGTQTVK